jgi:hypothetical protein
MALCAHDRNHLPGQVVPAEQVGLELGAQCLAGQVLDRAGLAVGAVIEQCVQRAAGQREGFAETLGDAGRVVEVEPNGQQTFVGESCHVPRPSGGGDHLPAAPCQGLGAGVADTAGAPGNQDAASLSRHGENSHLQAALASMKRRRSRSYGPSGRLSTLAMSGDVRRTRSRSENNRALNSRSVTL